MNGNASAGAVTPGHVYTPVRHFPYQDDAFYTIMSWLHSKIADTR